MSTIISQIVEETLEETDLDANFYIIRSAAQHRLDELNYPKRPPYDDVA